MMIDNACTPTRSIRSRVDAMLLRLARNDQYTDAALGERTRIVASRHSASQSA